MGKWIQSVWNAEIAVVRGIRAEFSHVVYFILIERVIHHSVALDWSTIVKSVMEVVLPAIGAMVYGVLRSAAFGLI